VKDKGDKISEVNIERIRVRVKVEVEVRVEGLGRRVKE